ncbi:DUF4185 domain-containing protein [Mycobacterium sp. OTB74]|uniref:DUF4185 domain-containing protein n=1 Tax=Mycobacterium sp. OTB74 TaxID=1853452 RepID=UPI002474EBAD|nr:DUF4185 domain-containing protein [Mycobacterium sp. OTB74]MDH6246068.1 hypothetical protein [Mycobacterium sp. OTB74]
MDSSKYIGRVGALAVALGIGTAMASGTGMAWADDNGTSGKTSTHNTNASTDSSAGEGSATKKPAATRQSPLSKLADQVRKDLQSQLDKTRTPLSGKATGSKTASSDIVEQAATQTGKPTRTRSDNAKTYSSPAQRPSTVAPKIAAATDTVTKPVSTPATTAPVVVSAVAPAEAVQTLSITSLSASQVMSTAHVTTPQVAAPPVVSTLLAAVGLSPLAAGGNPVTPQQSPLLWAVMAWARREFDRSVNPSGTRLVSATNAASVVAESTVQPTAAVSPSTTTTTAAATDNLTPKPTVPSSLSDFTTQLGWVTGTGVTDHWYVAGTDLGILWNSGYTDSTTGKAIIYALFGDTYSGANMTGDWRNNVLFRTSDTVLSNGLQFSDAMISAGAQYPGDPNGVHQWYSTQGPPAGATQIIYDPGGLNGLFGQTYTMIPTSAIAIKNADGTYTQYATVMSIRTWDNPGSWTTNYAAIATSTDGGKNWTVDPSTVRSSGWFRASTAYVPGDEHFQQSGLVMSNDPTDPYVYVYGTPSGRQGSAYLARVQKDQITDLGAYQYWSGQNSSGVGQWVTGDPSAAIPVFGSNPTDFLPSLYKVLDCFTFGLFSKIANGIWVGGLPTFGNVSEMSVQYNDYLGKYVVLYTDGGNNVVMRESDSPQGTWSDPTTLVTNNYTTNTGMYAPMVHPMSGTGYFNTTNPDGTIQDNSHYLYYDLSYWGDYNVQLMQTDLQSMKTVSV